MPTKVTLTRRHHGAHLTLKELVIPTDYVALVKIEEDEPVVDEASLLAALPPKWISVEASRVLLIADDTYVRQPKSFRKFGKYFDAYSVMVSPIETSTPTA